MLKKIAAIILSATVALCCFSGCVKPQKKSVSLIIKVPTLSLSAYCDEENRTSAEFLRKAANDFALKYNAENSGVEVSFEVIEFEIAKESEFITDKFDTPTAADILYEGYFNMSTYIYTGRVVPLDDIIDDSLRADVTDSYWGLSKVNGKTYMMPYLSMQNTLVFNRDIFKAAGLTEYIGEGKDDIVQTWTLDEWEEVLSSLKTYCDGNNSDPTSEQAIYPMMMYATSDQGDTHIITLLRSQGCPFYGADGKINVNNEQGIAALQWLQDLANDGIFPPNCADMTIEKNSELFYNGQLAIYMTNAQTDVAIASHGVKANTVNFPYVNGGLATDFVTGFEVFDNGDEDKIAASKAFIKYIYNSKYINYMAGSMPCSKSVAQRYETELSHIGKYIANANNAAVESWNFTNNSPNWRGIRGVFWQNINDLLTVPQKSAEAVAAAIDEVCNAVLTESLATGTLHP